MTERDSRINLYDSYDDDQVDRISALPDSILSRILSSLPTKNAVATSLLSKRWKFAWVIVHNLDFDCNYENEPTESETMKFVGFVNHVLRLNDVGVLNKLSLLCGSGITSSHVSSWINTATTKNVQELSFSRRNHDEQFEMPLDVFNCSSLRSLELRGDIHVSAPIEVFLPRLETLKLFGAHFQSEDAFEKLLSGCPILNHLHLHMCKRNDDGFMVKISSTSLRRLEINFHGECGLKLNACSLEYLTVDGEISEILVQNNLESLVEAGLDIIYNEHASNSVVASLQALDCAKTMTLSGDILGFLMDAGISLSKEFKRLVELKIKTYTWDCNSLQDFIRYTSNLEVLTIDQHGRIGSENWNSPEQVPRCYSNSLKTVIIDGYHGYEDERETICYILNHGSALEVMQISFDESVDDSGMMELMKEIREFPRESPICEVKFLQQT